METSPHNGLSNYLILKSLGERLVENALQGHHVQQLFLTKLLQTTIAEFRQKKMLPKIPTWKQAPSNGKEASIQETPDRVLDKPIGWNFHTMDQKGPWPCTFKRLNKCRKQLLEYEGRKYSEVFTRSNHCHPMPADVLIPHAQNRLKMLGYENATLHQLAIGDIPGRLWGIVQHNIFHLLWIDPKHKVYPTKK